jgi:hypothetical protein
MGKLVLHYKGFDDYEGGEIFLGHIGYCGSYAPKHTWSWSLVTCKRCLKLMQRKRASKEPRDG